jgi:hypothetical protein
LVVDRPGGSLEQAASLRESAIEETAVVSQVGVEETVAFVGAAL